MHEEPKAGLIVINANEVNLKENQKDNLNDSDYFPHQDIDRDSNISHHLAKMRDIDTIFLQHNEKGEYDVQKAVSTDGFAQVKQS